MTDLLNLTMLVAASAGSLAFGILAAYAVLRTAFGLMRPREVRVPVKARPELAR